MSTQRSWILTVPKSTAVEKCGKRSGIGSGSKAWWQGCRRITSVIVQWTCYVEVCPRSSRTDQCNARDPIFSARRIGSRHAIICPNIIKTFLLKNPISKIKTTYLRAGVVLPVAPVSPVCHIWFSGFADDTGSLRRVSRDINWIIPGNEGTN